MQGEKLKSEVDEELKSSSSGNSGSVISVTFTAERRRIERRWLSTFFCFRIIFVRPRSHLASRFSLWTHTIPNFAHLLAIA